MGMKTRRRCASVLPRATDEAVHRDYFVLGCRPVDGYRCLAGRPSTATLRSPRSAAPPSDAVARARARCRRGARTPRCEAIADALEARDAEILEANARDLEAGRASRARRARCSTGCALDDGARSRRWPTACARSRRCPTRSARSIDGRRLPNGLDVRKVRVPLGVVAVVYEARPNVTIDAAALCLKSRQRDRAARLVARRRTPTRCWRRSPRGGRRRPACPTGAVVARRRRRARGARRARHPGGRRRPDHPARRRGAEGGAEGASRRCR